MTDTKPSIKINFIMNTLLTLSSFLFPLISFPYVSRILAPAGIGRVSFAQSLVSYFLLLSQLGISSYGIRVVAQSRDNREELSRTAQELLGINALMTLVAYAGLLVTTLLVPKLYANAELIMVCSISIVFNTLGMEWLYRGLEQYTSITWRSLLFKTIALVLMFVLIHTSEDYTIYAMITVFAASAPALLNFVNAGKYIELKPRAGLNFHRHIKAICTFFAMSCATTIYTNLDTVMLGFMSSESEVGYYNASIKCKIVLIAFVTSLGTVLLPRASYYAERKRDEELKKLIALSFNFVLVCAAAVSVYSIMYAEDIVLLLSGAGFLPAAESMKIIMPTVLLIAISNVTGIQILVPLGGEKYVLYSEIAGAVTDVCFNAVLIPRYGAAGAAMGTVAAEIAVLAVQLGFLYAHHNDYLSILKSTSYVKILIAAAAAVSASIWCIRLECSAFIILCVSAGIYFGIYVAALIIMRERLTCDMLRRVCAYIRPR